MATLRQQPVMPYRDRPRKTGFSLVPMLTIIWVLSLGRVLVALFMHETFGAELTLALVAVAVVPLLMSGKARALYARARRSKHA
jgi:hypothetical protein